ncbi:MAG: HipA domain-containing protein [Atopobiaceae bacterium]
MASLEVLRVEGTRAVRVGTIERKERGQESFAYSESYLERSDAPLSQSLPLGSRKFTADEMRPYFEGLLAEGAAREELAAKVGVPLGDYLSLLAVVGLDCIGDVVVRPLSGPGIAEMAWDEGSYEEASLSDIGLDVSSPSAMARRSEESRLSLSGTQGKIGLAHLPGEPMDRGWLIPEGGAASTHILKVSSMSRITEFELVCMRAAARCGINVPDVGVLGHGRLMYWVKRFDRSSSLESGALKVVRLHQEDCAQAFGVTSAAKYAELEGGTYACLASMLARTSDNPLGDIDQLARIVVFNYLVGNCDNHLKNLSLIYEGGIPRLAPAYDIVCTTFFERFSREMGARLGSTRRIDDVGPADFETLARELGLGIRRMRSICSELASSLVPALLDSGEEWADVSEAIPFSAEDVADDASERRLIVERFANGMNGK